MSESKEGAISNTPGWRKVLEKVTPFLRRPKREARSGRPNTFALTMTFGMTACGMLFK